MFLCCRRRTRCCFLSFNGPRKRHVVRLFLLCCCFFSDSNPFLLNFLFNFTKPNLRQFSISVPHTSCVLPIQCNISYVYSLNLASIYQFHLFHFFFFQKQIYEDESLTNNTMTYNIDIELIAKT